jgi:hypothetical protein
MDCEHSSPFAFRETEWQRGSVAKVHRTGKESPGFPQRSFWLLRPARHPCVTLPRSSDVWMVLECRWLGLALSTHVTSGWVLMVTGTVLWVSISPLGLHGGGVLVTLFLVAVRFCLSGMTILWVSAYKILPKNWPPGSFLTASFHNLQSSHIVFPSLPSCL